MKKIAVYRVLYGEDFIQKSINSIIDHVDEVYVFWSDKPWTDPKTVTYLGETITFPSKFDNVVEKVQELNNPKIKLIYDYYPTPKNQHRHFVNDIIVPQFGKPDILVWMEPDMVFAPGMFARVMNEFESMGVPYMCVPQIELWKDYGWRIPFRNRTGPQLIRYTEHAMYSTGFNGRPELLIPVWSTYGCYNFGFCLNVNTMFWKHMTAIAFSRAIGDSVPSETWYRDKWLNWNPETTNLEISANHTHLIPKAIPYKQTHQMMEYMTK